MAAAFNKDLLRSITKSWGRFLAIAIIAALGAGFYAGLRMTGPDMRLAGDEYYDGTNLSDVRVVSTLGLTDAEVEQIRDVQGVEGVMPAYEADAISELDGVQYTIRYHSLDVNAARASTTDGANVESSDADYMNRLILESGSWPENADECLLSADAVWQSDVHIGDKVHLVEGTQSLDDTFAEKEFTVCGFVRSSYYTCSTNTGSTQLGSGSLSTFIYVPNDAFAGDYPYTEAFVTVAGAHDEAWGSDAYQEKVDEVAGRIDAIAGDLKASRIAGLQATAQAELDDARAQFESEKADAQAEIDDIATMDADVYVLDLTKNVGAESFRSDAGRIDQIAQVFPLFFFLVAALVSLTTMTRMVDEERVLIGTFKALGYSNGRIASKFLVYAAVASGVGSVVGIVLLSQFLPWFIMHAYSIIYAVPCCPTPIDPGMFALSAGLSVGITVAATLFAAMATLREKPAALMLPRAPKAGKRILLERIRPLWSRMSFSWKVTARNLFRYKRRFFMAVVGIAGCTGLLLTGLGLQNAINDIIDKQYGELYHYNAIVRMDADATDAQKADVADRVQSDSQGPKAWIATDNKIVRTAGNNDVEQRVELEVPQDAANFGEFNTLRTRVGHEPLALDDSGVLISEKLATKLGVKAGDSIEICDEDAIGNASGEGRQVRVAGVMEHYVAQYVLMSPGLYEQVMGEAPNYATLFANVAEGDDVRATFSDDLLATDGVKTVTYNDETIGSYRSMLKSVDSVVVVLVVAAALLAFVVLYNLTNINITERVREIATLKVLGFTPHEVNAYIYRETMLLALIGALVGLALGVAMEGFVVVTAEVDQVMFGREIHLLSFVIAFVLTMVFAVVVTVAMRGKLRHVDMVESLKSVE